MLKKIVLFVLVAALIAGMLCACSMVVTPETPASASALKTPVPSTSPSASSSASPDMNPYGMVSGQKYTNSAAGFEITLPEGYKIINSADSLREYRLETFDAHKALYKNPDTIKQRIKGSKEVGFVAYMHLDGKPEGLNNEMSASVEKLDSSVKAGPTEIAKVYIDTIKQDTDKFEFTEPKLVNLGGINCASFTNSYTLSSVSVIELYYIFINNGYAVLFCESATDESSTEEMIKSFITLNFAPGASAVSASSADIEGTTNGNTYTNQATGFTISYPDSYTVLDKNQIKDMMADTIDTLKGMYKDPKLVEKAIQQNIPVSQAFMHELGYTGGTNSNINILVQSVSISNILDLANANIKAMQEQANNVKYGEAASITFAGREAAVVSGTMEINGVVLYQRLYLVPSNGYVVYITLTGANEQELSELDKIANGIQFTM